MVIPPRSPARPISGLRRLAKELGWASPFYRRYGDRYETRSAAEPRGGARKVNPALLRRLALRRAREEMAHGGGESG